MRRLVTVTAAVLTLVAAGSASAFQCPTLIKQGKDTVARLKTDDPRAREATAKLAEAQKLHDAGKHADSVKIANEALALLGVKK